MFIRPKAMRAPHMRCEWCSCRFMS